MPNASRQKPPVQTPRRQRGRDPELPDEVQIGQLDREVRGRLRALSKEHAELVGRHLVMTGYLLDIDPELAYLHAQAAVRHASRIDVVREAAGIAAYRTGRYGEALSELRTARRLSGSSQHLAVMADAERGLGRPEKAIELGDSPEAKDLDLTAKAELAIVVSGARCDLQQWDAALATLDRLPDLTGDLQLRVLSARSDVLAAAGRKEEAARIVAAIDPKDLARISGLGDPDVMVFDAFEDESEAEDGAE